MREEIGALAFFNGLPLFQGLQREQLERLARLATARDYVPGERILSENEQVRDFFILASGRAKLFKALPDGKEQTVCLFSPGEPFCLCSIFDGERHPANAAALEVSRVYRIAGLEFLETARESPELLFNLLLATSRRLKEALDRIESLSMKDIGQRLAIFMLSMAGELDKSVDIRLPLTHRELAKVIGVTPEALSRTFRRLAEDGLLQVDGQHISLLDRQALVTLAKSGPV